MVEIGSNTLPSYERRNTQYTSTSTPPRAQQPVFQQGESSMADRTYSSAATSTPQSPVGTNTISMTQNGTAPTATSPSTTAATGTSQSAAPDSNICPEKYIHRPVTEIEKEIYTQIEKARDEAKSEAWFFNTPCNTIYHTFRKAMSTFGTINEHKELFISKKAEDALTRLTEKGKDLGDKASKWGVSWRACEMLKDINEETRKDNIETPAELIYILKKLSDEMNNSPVTKFVHQNQFTSYQFDLVDYFGGSFKNYSDQHDADSGTQQALSDFLTQRSRRFVSAASDFEKKNEKIKKDLATAMRQYAGEPKEPVEAGELTFKAVREIFANNSIMKQVGELGATDNAKEALNDLFAAQNNAKSPKEKADAVLNKLKVLNELSQAEFVYVLKEYENGTRKTGGYERSDHNALSYLGSHRDEAIAIKNFLSPPPKKSRAK